MVFDITTLPAQSTFRLVSALDNTTASPTVTLTWEEDSNGPYKQVDNTSGNDVLLTELPITISADKAASGGSEEFWLTGGALVSGETRQVQYTATYRGLLNSNATNPPTASYSRNYRSHDRNAFCVVDEAWLVKSLDALLDASVAAADNKYVQFQLFGGTQDNSVGDGRAYFKVPAGYDGHNLSAVTASVVTAGTTGTLDIQIHNVTDAVDMLSTKLTIDSGETTSETAATAAVIDTANDDVSTNDLLRIDIDAVHTTAAKGLVLGLTFNDPS